MICSTSLVQEKDLHFQDINKQPQGKIITITSMRIGRKYLSQTKKDIFTFITRLSYQDFSIWL